MSQLQEEEFRDAGDVVPVAEQNGHMTIKSILQFIKIKVDEIYTLKQNGQTAEVEQIYEKELRPHLLKLRRQNRGDKMKLEAKLKKVKDMNKCLMDLYRICDCFEFEVAQTGSEVLSVKKKASPVKALTNGFSKSEEQMDVDQNDRSTAIVDNFSKQEHESRMKQLEEEANKRKELQMKLKALEEETREIEELCTSTGAMVNEVKPYIKQLLDKVKIAS